MSVFMNVTAEMYKDALRIFDENTMVFINNLIQKHELHVTVVDLDRTVNISGQFDDIHKTHTLLSPFLKPVPILDHIENSTETSQSIVNSSININNNKSVLQGESSSDETDTEWYQANIKGDNDECQTVTNKRHTNSLKCTVCSKNFRNSKQLDAHILRHEMVREYKCNKCSRRYRYEKKMVEHVQKCSGEKKCATCGLCDKVFDDKTHLQNHIRIVHFKTPILTHNNKTPYISVKHEVKVDEYELDEVGSNTLQSGVLKDSIIQDNREIDRFDQEMLDNTSDIGNTAKEESTLVCSFCPYIGKTKDGLKSHERYSHKRRFTCPMCGKAFGSRKDVRRHSVTHQNPVHKCHMCGKMYKEFKSMVDHMKRHEESYVAPTVRCEYCPKTFSSKGYLKKHTAVVHLGQKMTTYLCQTCGKQFSQKNHYHTHLSIHLDIKPFVCEVCGVAFALRKYLTMHRFTHSEARNFECSICYKRFKQPEVLKSHKRIHSGLQNHVCSYCQRRFNTRGSLVRHERIHLGIKPFACRICNETFRDTSIVRRHLLLVHKCGLKTWNKEVMKIPPNECLMSDYMRDSKIGSNGLDLQPIVPINL